VLYAQDAGRSLQFLALRVLGLFDVLELILSGSGEGIEGVGHGTRREAYPHHFVSTFDVRGRRAAGALRQVLRMRGDCHESHQCFGLLAWCMV